MTLDQLRYFKMLAEVLNYTKAAQSLHLSQPALSSAMSRLEFEVGAKLLRRDARLGQDVGCDGDAGIVERGDCLSLKTLAVNGGDLLAAGIEPGRKVGAILTQMLDDVLDVPEHNNKEYLMGRYCR